MEQLQTDLKTLCFQAPHWQQLVVQAFWYGMMNWLIPLKEAETQPSLERMTPRDLVKHADAEFADWPADWLQPYMERTVALNLSLDDLYDLYDNLNTVFQDCVPTDLVIFTELSNGENLTEAQWERLYEAVAFQPIPKDQRKKQQKTRRTHGRRAITPIRRRRAMTHHNRAQHMSVVKIGATQ